MMDKHEVSFDVLLQRFREKMNSIPREYHAAMGWLYVYRHVQEQRKRLGNRAIQMFGEGKRVFWATVLPPEVAAPIAATLVEAVGNLEKAEQIAARNIHKLLKDSSWYTQVAVPAAKGFGMSENAGTLSAAKIMWAYGSASRFATFGKIVRYSRLAPEDGKGPKRERGARIRYNPQAWQALFDLSETWNRMPDCYWRLRWDGWKAYYAEKYPEYPKGRIHNMARRKVLREFLKDLYELWLVWEEERRSLVRLSA